MSEMNSSDFEAMARQHFGLDADEGATAATVTNLAAFARRVYELGERDGRYIARPAAPPPPPGIANFLLACGHIAQMKDSYARLHLCRYLWCTACNCAREITQAPEQEMRT
jgi:hypothetical protein